MNTNEQAAPVVPNEMLAALRAYKRASLDGSVVSVSRQALDEAIALLESGQSAVELDRQGRGEPIDVDDLAQEIRRVDGWL